MKLNSRIHGTIDYAVVLFLFLSPTLFHLPELTTGITYVIAIVHLLLTVFTNFEFGIWKVLPFKIHGKVELIVSASLIGVGFYMGSIEGNIARNFFIGFAIAVFLTWFFTDYNSKMDLNNRYR